MIAINVKINGKASTKGLFHGVVKDLTANLKIIEDATITMTLEELIELKKTISRIIDRELSKTEASQSKMSFLKNYYSANIIKLDDFNKEEWNQDFENWLNSHTNFELISLLEKNDY